MCAVIFVALFILHAVLCKVHVYAVPLNLMRLVVQLIGVGPPSCSVCPGDRGGRLRLSTLFCGLQLTAGALVFSTQRPPPPPVGKLEPWKELEEEGEVVSTERVVAQRQFSIADLDQLKPELCVEIQQEGRK